MSDLTEDEKKARKAAQRKAYYAANRDKILAKNSEYFAGYYQRNRDKIKDNVSKNYHAPEKAAVRAAVTEKLRVDRARAAKKRKLDSKKPENKARVAEQQRVRSAKYREKNRELIAARANEYYKNNTAKARASMLVSQSRRRGAVSAAKEHLRPFYNYAQIMRIAEGDLHVDHFVPLALGGLNVPRNLHIIPASENSRKHDIHPRVFYGERYEEVKRKMRAQQNMIMGIRSDA